MERNEVPYRFDVYAVNGMYCYTMFKNDEERVMHRCTELLENGLVESLKRNIGYLISELPLDFKEEDLIKRSIPENYVDSPSARNLTNKEFSDLLSTIKGE